MSLRPLALALLVPLLVTGCMPQRDSSETTADTSGGPMPPNIPAYIYGTWDYTMTEISGDDPVTGTLVLEEAPAASRMALSTGVDAPLVIERVDVTNANFVLVGTVQAEGRPMPLTLAGSLSGDEMTAEADVWGMGAYALTGTRRRN